MCFYDAMGWIVVLNFFFVILFVVLVLLAWADTFVYSLLGMEN